MDFTGYRIVSRPFSAYDLVGGNPALDLVNTVTARNTPLPVDWLDFYPRLLDWATLAEILDAPIAETLRARAAKSPDAAAQALARIKAFREALHDVCAALIRGERVPDAALALVDQAWKQAQSRARIAQKGDRIEVRLDPESSGLDLILDRLARAAVELLLHWPQARGKICRGGQCGWLFIDTSKAGRRVWCDMATCGNAAKTRRFASVRRQHLRPD